MEYSEESVLSLISHIHTITADFTNRRLPAEEKFVSSHGFILYLLSTKGTLTKGQIAQYINRDKSTTTVLVKKLIGQGLVQEAVSANDSRVKELSLTAKGKKYNELTSGISAELRSLCYRGFSAAQKKQLVSLLKKMSGNIEDALLTLV